MVPAPPARTAVSPLSGYGLLSLVANLSLALVKLLTGFLGSSYALIADGVESLADVFSSLLIWNGLRIADKPADTDHPYGHGKAEAIAGLLGAAALLISAGLIAVSAVHELITPHAPPAFFTIPVLIAIIASKEALHRFLRRQARRVDSAALHVEAWHHRIDTLTSLGVLVGLLVAVIMGEGWARADDVAALLVSGLIVYNAFKLARPCVDDLMDRTVEGRRVAEMETIATGVEGVERLETLHVRRSGSRYLVEVHVEVDGELTVTEGHNIGHHVKNALMTAPGLRIAHVVTHVEPRDRDISERNKPVTP